jgi:hypothetical protein
LLSAIAIALAVPAAADAQPAVIAVGRVAVAHEVDARTDLPAAIGAELRALPGLVVAPAPLARYVIHVSVRSLSRSSRDGVACEVSIIVEDRLGAVRMILGGRARAYGDGGPLTLETRAVRGAVRSALRPLTVEAVASRL